MSSKRLLKGAQTGGIRLISRNLFLLASLIVLISCFAFISCDVPEENDVTDIIFDRASVEINSLNYDYLTFTVQPSGAVYERVDWKSNDDTIVEVNDGIIKAKKQGTTNVSVTIGKITRTCSIKVLTEQGGTQVTGVVLNKNSLTLAVNGSETLTAGVTPSNAANKNVFWISDNAGVAAVDSNSGKVTAKTTGSAKIAAYSKNGGKKATCDVTVTAASVPGTGTGNINVTSIGLNKEALTLTVGGTEKLIATVLPSNATNQTVTWDSSDKTKVTVDKDGNVAAVAVTTEDVAITASIDPFEITCYVKVTAIPVTSVKLNKNTLTLNVGASEPLTTTILPDNTTNQTVTWNSSDESKVTVKDGIVTAVAAGTATITAAIGDIKDTCAVTVNNVLITSLALDNTSVTLLKGETVTLNVTIQPATATIKDLKWTVNNTVSSVKGSSIDVTGTVAGPVTITVTSTDGTNKTATCNVTVIDLAAGKYAVKYTNNDSKDINETIELSKDRFYIYDDNKTGADLEYLDFSIAKWESATTPNDQKGTYPTAYKITGKITGAKPVTTGSPNSLYGPSTASGFTQSDIKTGTAQGTDCWMYIYVSNDGKFIRSAFSKAGMTEATGPVTASSLRVYTKTP